VADAPLVLVVEDEPPVRHFLRAALEANGYRLVEAATIRDGLAQAAGRKPDVILLDLGLPDGDGIDLTKRLREWATMPIIVISARGRDPDKVAALDAGADDYLTKPFSIDELLARIRVALRHTVSATAASPIFTTGDLVVDQTKRLVTVRGSTVHLTPTEYRLLTVMVKHAGRVLTHKQLRHEVWGAHTTTSTQALRVYMNQLRHKIEAEAAHPRLLITEPGVGYRLRDG